MISVDALGRRVEAHVEVAAGWTTRCTPGSVCSAWTASACTGFSSEAAGGRGLDDDGARVDRRRMSEIVESSTFTPRSIMKMRSQSCSASYIACVEKMIVRPWPCCSLDQLRIRIRLSGSSPEDLVGDDQVGLVDDRGHELHLLLHALGQLLALLLGAVAESDAVEPERNAPAGVAGVDALEAGRCTSGTRARILRYSPRSSGNSRSGPSSPGGGGLVEHRDLAPVREDDRHDHPDRGGLARAVRTDEPAERAHQDFQSRSRTATLGPKVLVTPRMRMAAAGVA